MVTRDVSTLLETIPDRVWLKDTHGIYLTCNTAFAEHFGATAAQIIGTADAQWVGAAMAQEFLKADRTVIETGQSLTMEGPMPSPAHQDATIFEVIKTSMRGADGHITSVLSMGRNIKARKDTEARLRDATEQLELALMGADLGRWDHDLSVEKGYYLDERSCAMLGRDALESTHGRAWGHLTHHDDLPGTLDAMRAHLSGAVPAYEAEYQARHTSGHWVWMGNRGKAVQFSQNGKPLRMVGTLMNISKRKQVEGELLATQSELQSTLKAEVAQRLQQCIRAIDTVARLGGDEFVVLIQNLSVDHGDAKLHAATVGHKILFSLNEPYQLKGVEHNTTPSIGATLFLGRATVGADLLKQADMAMYEAKAQGRNTLCFFQERGLYPSPILRKQLLH